MMTDTGFYDAMVRVFQELIRPQLEVLRADIRRLEERLEATALPLNPHAGGRVPPLSEQGRAYLDTLCTEIGERLERTAREWAERRAEEAGKK